MSLSSEITSMETALALVRDADYAPADIVKLLDHALLNPVREAGRLVASYSIGGRQVTMGQRDALELRKYYAELANDIDGYDCAEVVL